MGAGRPGQPPCPDFFWDGRRPDAEPVYSRAGGIRVADIISIKTGAEPAGSTGRSRIFAVMANTGIARRSFRILAAALLASTMLLPTATRAASVLPEPQDGLHRRMDA